MYYSHKVPLVNFDRVIFVTFVNHSHILTKLALPNQGGGDGIIYLREAYLFFKREFITFFYSTA